MKQTIVLDNNGWSYLFGNPWIPPSLLRKLRNTLRWRVEEGRLDFLTSPSLLVEAARIRGDLRADVLREVLRLSGRKILLDLRDRIVQEARIRGSLPNAARYLNDRALETVLRRLGDAQAICEIDDAVRQEVERFRVEERRRKESIERKVGKDRSRLTRQWFARREENVADWCLDFMRENARRWRLPQEEGEWPHPRELPTLWHLVSYHHARIARIFGDGQGPDPSDKYDAACYADAAHADVLVSEDRRFREKCSLVPRPDLVVLSFREWARRVLTGES
ncbi:MAG: hypothetical protein HY721_30235 [Planctomycetes bacterium]|nr:hypothetical protein [Planctomycetota bacterium]